MRESRWFVSWLLAASMLELLLAACRGVQPTTSASTATLLPSSQPTDAGRLFLCSRRSGDPG